MKKGDLIMTYSSIRDIYFEAIYDLIKQGEDIVLVSADLAAPSLDKFRKDFGNRFVSVGIAEQNLITIACGIALTGKRVIAYGLNPFPITRAFDQIRNTVCSLNLPITIAVLNAGLCSAESGATHFAIEDLNLVRTLPLIKTINVSDQAMAKKAALNTAYSKQPSFVRFDKHINYRLYDEETIDFETGFAVIGSGKDIAIVTTGYHAGLIKNQIDKLNKFEMNITVIDCYAIPLNEEKLAKILEDFIVVVTVEENCIRGGIGSMVLELLSDNEIQKPVKRIAVDFKNGYPKNFGDRNYFMKKLGLDLDCIFGEAFNFYKKYS